MNSESLPRSQGESVCPIVIARETHLAGEKELPTRSGPMRSTIAGCILLMAMCLVVGAQNGRVANDESARILSLENAWNQAEVKHDARALSLLLAETFEYTDSDGSFMNKSHWLAHVKNEVDQYEQLGNSGMTVHVYGNAAVVRGISREDKGQRKGGCALRSFYRYLDSAEWRVEVRGEPGDTHQPLGPPLIPPVRPRVPEF